MLNRSLVSIALLSALLIFTAAIAQQSSSPSGTDGIMTMALTGDSIITQRLSPFQEPAYLDMVNLIREADLAFTNLEMLLHDYEGYPSAQSGGTYMRGDPILARELAWAGFDMVSRANNHTGDYSVESMRTTDKYLGEAGIVHAGTGYSLQQAREARFLETADGRVALISSASTFPPSSVAGRQRSDVKGRPGLNPLRFTTRYTINQSGLDRLGEVASSLGLPVPGADRDTFRFLGTTFVRGDEPGREQTPNEGDMEEILAAVRDAKALADYVIVTIHAHESGTERTVPADFLPIFARAAIDAGADVFVGHGPHVLRGIELYKGKPIMYSLGDFIFQNETVLRLPADNYERYDLNPEGRISEFNGARYNNDTTGFPSQPMIWESVVAVPQFKGQNLTGLRLHPISLGFGKPSGRRGRPQFADAELSRKIIDDIARFSEPFGTKVTFEDGIGVVEIPGASSNNR